MIRGVIFDFGNVICSFDNRIFTRRLTQHCSHDENEVHRILYERCDVVDRYETGMISSLDFYREAKELLDLSINIETFREAFTNIFTPIQETIDTIKELRSKGYRLGLLSNTNEWDHEFGIRSVEVYSLFDAVTVSYQIKAKKPDERIYLDCLKKLELQPEECIFIDDIEQYVIKARKIGMNGINFTSNTDYKDVLYSLGIDLF